MLIYLYWKTSENVVRLTRLSVWYCSADNRSVCVALFVGWLKRGCVCLGVCELDKGVCVCVLWTSGRVFVSLVSLWSDIVWWAQGASLALCISLCVSFMLKCVSFAEESGVCVWGHNTADVCILMKSLKTDIPTPATSQFAYFQS